MKKEEFIKRRGEGAYKKKQQQDHAGYIQHREERRERAITRVKKWQEANPDKAKANNQERCHKGGKYYGAKLEYNHTGLQGERSRIRVKHAIQYHPFKHIISPDSQIHHEWIPGTANYCGVALVEKNPHRHGIIDVIQILEGQVTLFTEKEIAKQEVEKWNQ